MGEFFRLKSGGHVVGDVGKPTHKYIRASDPNNNILESDIDLALEEPTRWERVHPTVAKSQMQASAPGGQVIPNEPPSPLPPDQQPGGFINFSNPVGGLTSDAKRKRAEELRRLAESLEAEADTSDEAIEGAEKNGGASEATQHQFESLAASDSHQQMNKEWEERKKQLEANAKKAQAQAESVAAANAKDAKKTGGANNNPRQPTTTTGPSDEDLDGMTVEQLREAATKNDINLHGASTKAEITKAIKAHYRGQK